MALEFSTAGVLLKYAVETTAGTKPSAFTTINGIKSIPDFNPTPSNLDCTDLSDTQYKRSIPGLQDPGGALAFKANLTAAFETAWGALVTASETAKGDGKATWFEVYVPGFKGFYFTGIPSALGMPAMEVDSVIEIDAYITPNTIGGWDTLA